MNIGYRGGPCLGKKHTLNQFHIAAPEFLRGRKKNETWRNLVNICSHMLPVKFVGFMNYSGIVLGSVFSSSFFFLA